MGIGGVGLQRFSIFSSGGHLVYRSDHFSYLAREYLGTISEMIESHWPKGLGGDSI